MLSDSQNSLREQYLTQEERNLLQLIHNQIPQ
jgi:hypothetical protein